MKKKMIKLICAFSRDQKEKIYVQDKVKELMVDVNILLNKDCYIYICGSLQMCKDVQRSLCEISKEGLIEELKLKGKLIMEFW